MERPGRPKSALSDIRVLDLSDGTAGQVAAMLFGDFGADVIRIVSPPAHPGHGSDPGEPMWDRNKRIVRSAPDAEAVTALLATADLVVTSRSAAANAAERARTGNSGLIHLSLPGFRVGENTPSRSADGLMTAATGIARRQSSYDGGPVEPVFPYVTYEQALWGTTCGVAGLIERERTGTGQQVVVDGMHAALITAAATMVVDPLVAPPDTAVGPHGPNPAYSTYRGSDGKWLLLGALLPKFQIAAFELLGVADILTDPRIAGDHAKLYSVEHRDWVRARIAAAFAARPRDEWLVLLEEVDCPASAVAEAGVFLDHPQMVALGQRKVVDDPEFGAVEMPWTPVELIGTPAVEPVSRSFDNDVDWLPRHRGPARGPVGRTAADMSAGGPLTGFRVLDLGAVLAGPFAGSLLAELGAEVVKVEPSAADSFRHIGWHYNRGQRSFPVDLRNSEGNKVFRTVVAESDVVLDNFRPGVLQRLGIDHEALAGVRPDIVTGSITGFGNIGPYAGKPGFDPILQAASGMMAAQGGAGDPVFSSIAVNDVTAACAMALGSCLALYHRARCGEGQRFDVSLTTVAAYMQCGELTRYQARPAVRFGAPDYRGPSPLDRYYETADGAVRLYLPSARLLAESGLLESIPADPVQLQDQLAGRLRELDTSDAVKLVIDAGGDAAAAVTYQDLSQDPDVLSGGYLQPITRADGKEFFVPGRYARFDRGRIGGALRAPGLGEHSRELLRSVGLADEAIDELIGRGVVAEGGPLTEFSVALYR
ncbi:CoA transferase [Nocardia aobensis]|uniref:CoA transferase n=1 Tax=Nocardia aobensis TaxID=257277 RepID=A0ABW6P9D8_9NOCA